jgi:hypothetical protein
MVGQCSWAAETAFGGDSKNRTATIRGFFALSGTFSLKLRNQYAVSSTPICG